MNRIIAFLAAFLFPTLLWAQQPPDAPLTPEELVSRQHAATGMLLTIVIALTVIILLLHLLSRRDKVRRAAKNPVEEDHDAS